MNTLNKILILPILIILFSCEEVVDIELETAGPRLVINAPLEWKKDTDGNYQSIRLSKSAGFYESTPSKVSGAVVRVMNSDGNIFLFEEGKTLGLYECFNFQPQLFGEYELEVEYNNELYTGSEILYPVIEFDYTEQRTALEDLTEIRAYFTDPENTENFYLLEENSNVTMVPSYLAFNDRFFNGKQNYASHFDDTLNIGDEITFKLYGVSGQHHDYLFKLISSTQGGPFQTVPGVLRGNIVNITKPENYPLGYFSLSETTTITHKLTGE